jgi:DNA-binding transcriptional LysR family regulator
MDRYEAITILIAAVDGGSLSAASRRLRIPLATVSRRITELEGHLKTRLLLRGSRKLLLTDAGNHYLAACRRIMESVAEAERTAAGEYRAPQGELVISAPLIMGRTHAAPVIVEFQKAYPEVRVRLQLTDRKVSLIEEHVDLALRIGELPDSSLITTRVALIRPVLCASPSYLKYRDPPAIPADLQSHDCVAYENSAWTGVWDFLIDGTSQRTEVASRLVVNSSEAAIAVALAGAGIARVLSYQIDPIVASGALVTLLDEYQPAPMPASLIYPGQGPMPLKLRAFLDFAVPRLRERLGY